MDSEQHCVVEAGNSSVDDEFCGRRTSRGACRAGGTGPQRTGRQRRSPGLTTDEFHDRCRVEEAYPHDVLGGRLVTAAISTTAATRSSSPDGTRLADPVEVAEEIEFDVEVRTTPQIHQIDVGPLASLVEPDSRPEHLGTLLLGELLPWPRPCPDFATAACTRPPSPLRATKTTAAAALGEDLDDAWTP